MTASIPTQLLDKLATFGELLRYLRRRAGLTQTELSIAVGYSDAQISRLEQNLRTPNIPNIEARFLSALALKHEPAARERLLQLARDAQRQRADAEAANEPPPAAMTPSIAVLPFLNLSADPDNEYFCDGLAEELLSALTKIGRLFVVARASAFSFKGKNLDAREIGLRLNVDTIIEGSVKKVGDRVRVSVQLINADNGYQLWSGRYDRRMTDLFALQDDITLAIVEQLKVELLEKEKLALLRRHPGDLDAYNLYLKAAIIGRSGRKGSTRPSSTFCWRSRRIRAQRWRRPAWQTAMPHSVHGRTARCRPCKRWRKPNRQPARP
jgi:TolB-like protein/DNA-binding XRE family transcriptional regulator